MMTKEQILITLQQVIIRENNKASINQLQAVVDALNAYILIDPDKCLHQQSTVE
jgi:hypothetical protein